MCPPSVPLLASQNLLSVLYTMLVSVRDSYFLPLEKVGYEYYLIFLQPIEESNSNPSSMRQSCIEKAELGFAYLLCLFPWKLSSRPETWDLRPSSVFPLVLIMARAGSSVSANIYSISSIPFLFLIIVSYNRTGFCCSWWRTVGVGRRMMGEPHSTVSTPLSHQQCAHEGRKETHPEKQLRERTQLSKQFDLHWESIGEPEKHLNWVTWLCISFKIGLAAICL